MEAYVGQITIAAFPFAPQGWALCQGQSLPISQNQALYSLLGNYYTASPSTTNFNVPDLRGRTPTGWDMTGRTSAMLGTQAGTETVALSGTNLPLHQHTLYAAEVTAGNGNIQPNTGVLAKPIMPPLPGTPYNLYVPATPTPALVAMNPGTCVATGAGAPHDNMQPSLVVNFMIATVGYYPMRP